MAVAIIEHPDLKQYDLSTLTAILCGSAPAPVWIWEKFRDDLGISEIVTGYGMTECGGAMTLTLPEDPLELSSSTVGRTEAGRSGRAARDRRDLCHYLTVDPLTGEPLAEGPRASWPRSGRPR